MMIADRFQAMAALRGWSAEKKAAVLLDYIIHQRDDAAFLAFVAQQEAHPVMTRADQFLWAVAERLQHPALVLDPSFQLFCLDTFDLFTPEDAGAEWQRRAAV